MGQDWKSFEVHVRKSQDCLKRLLVEIQKMLLVKPQVEMRKMLLDTDERVILVTKNLYKLCSSILWKVIICEQ